MVGPILKGCLIVCAALSYVLVSLGSGMDGDLWRVSSGVVLFGAYGWLIFIFTGK